MIRDMTDKQLGNCSGSWCCVVNILAGCDAISALELYSGQVEAVLVFLFFFADVVGITITILYFIITTRDYLEV